MLWHGEKNHAARLHVMYWPVMGTLIAGLQRPGVDLVFGIGFSQRYQQMIDSLRCGDTFIWVGVNGKLSQPFWQLRKRGVRTVYYNTEPAVGYIRCDRDRRHVDELWDFSFHNMLRCAVDGNRRPDVLRGLLSCDNACKGE